MAKARTEADGAPVVKPGAPPVAPPVAPPGAPGTIVAGQLDKNDSTDLLNPPPPLVNAHMAEDPPPNPPAPPKMMRDLATASTPTSLPSDDGRYKYQPEFGPELELDEATGKRIDDLAMEILKANPDVAVDPKAAGADAYDRAVAIVTAAIDAGREHVMEKRSRDQRKKGNPEELKRQQAHEERRRAAYLGADFAANPKAYAKDPDDPSDQGPPESIPIDWRAIADEEGRRAGAFPAHV